MSGRAYRDKLAHRWDWEDVTRTLIVILLWLRETEAETGERREGVGRKKEGQEKRKRKEGRRERISRTERVRREKGCMSRILMTATHCVHVCVCVCVCVCCLWAVNGNEAGQLVDSVQSLHCKCWFFEGPVCNCCAAATTETPAVLFKLWFSWFGLIFFRCEIHQLSCDIRPRSVYKLCLSWISSYMQESEFQKEDSSLSISSPNLKFEMFRRCKSLRHRLWFNC